MKKSILTAFILLNNFWGFSQVTFHVNLLDKSINYNHLFSLIEKDIHLDSVRPISVYIAESKFNPTTDRYGVVGRLNDSTYVMNVDKEQFKSTQIRVFIHEMIHISQIENKRMKIGSNYVYFEGVVYGKDSTYEQRLYEVEAIELTDKLYMKYKKQR